VLQAPVITIWNPRSQQSGLLILTAHLGDVEYFQGLCDVVRSAPGDVFFEGIRWPADDSAHLAEGYHRFLRRIVVDLYEGISNLGVLAFQRTYLAPEPSWINADVTCCELASRLREQNVSITRPSMALGIILRLVERAGHGDEQARYALHRMLRWGLMAISVEVAFRSVALFPSTRRLHRVLNEWRSGNAARTVLARATGDFSMIYGAAHGPSLISQFEAAGFKETGREWRTVFAV
jgi:hypothetical protein